MSPSRVRLRRAQPGDATFLSALAQRSKAVWGYSPEFMAACVDELTYTAHDIARLHVVVAERDHQPIGFYALGSLADGAMELEALFLEPERMGQRHGGMLLEHARQRARVMGARRLTVCSDPNAEGFYIAAGARLTGRSESGSIPGRTLPTLVIDLV